jgi:hypothetical protein
MEYETDILRQPTILEDDTVIYSEHWPVCEQYRL